MVRKGFIGRVLQGELLWIMLFIFGGVAGAQSEQKEEKPTQAISAKEVKSAEVDLEKSLKKVLLEFDNKPKEEVIFLEDKEDKTLSEKCDYELGKGCRIYPGKKKKELVGFALIWQGKGFKGPIKIMLGILPEGDISGLEVLSQSETPQLGGKITSEEFQQQFLKRNLKNTKWMIEKEGGEIRAITGASVSTKAVISIVKEALEFYEKNKEDLKKKALSK